MIGKMHEIPITKEQVAQLAGVYFASAEVDDIPSKLWLDYWVAGDQLYLRAAFDHGVRSVSLIRLGALAMGLDERHGTALVTVAYDGDIEWEEIEERNRALNRVE